MLYFLQRSPFYRVERALVKVMTMTTGELDFESLFRLSSGPSSGGDNATMDIPYLQVSAILWIIFLIMMPILYTNLLVSASINYCQPLLCTAMSGIAITF